MKTENPCALDAARKITFLFLLVASVFFSLVGCRVESAPQKAVQEGFGFDGASSHAPPQEELRERLRLDGASLFTPPQEEGLVALHEEYFTLPFGGELRFPSGRRVVLSPGSVLRDDAKKIFPSVEGILSGMGENNTSGVTIGAEIREADGPAMQIESGYFIEFSDKPGAPFSDINILPMSLCDAAHALRNSVRAEDGVSPQSPLTRGLLVMILARNSNEGNRRYRPNVFDDSALLTPISFGDVDGASYFAAGLEWAKEEGIVIGRGDDRFEPDVVFSRQDMALILLRYARFTDENPLPFPERNPIPLRTFGDADGSGAASADFSDEAEIAAYAKDAVHILCASGIFSMEEGEPFRPKDGVTREEAAEILWAYIGQS
ncbi:MAG: S-layer homology domain-containing protein [Clostridiales Family XIII bacterium]|nr:S-layer homology domain-containing protein [Clostridiales Family XIII bacterium]